MKHWIVLLVAVLMVFAIYKDVGAMGGKTSISIGVGNNTNLTGSSMPWDNGGGTGAYFQFAHEYAFNEQVSILAQWVHISQWDVGRPFNNKSESSVDHVGVAMKWIF